MTFVASGQVGRHFWRVEGQFLSLLHSAARFPVRPLSRGLPARKSKQRRRGSNLSSSFAYQPAAKPRAPPASPSSAAGEGKRLRVFFGKVVDGQSCPPLNAGKALGVKAASTNPLRGCCRLRCVCVLVRARAARVAKRRETAPGRARRRSKTRRALAAFPRSIRAGRQSGRLGRVQPSDNPDDLTLFPRPPRALVSRSKAAAALTERGGRAQLRFLFACAATQVYSKSYIIISRQLT